MTPSRLRIGLEATLAVSIALLGVLTIFWRDWIEALTGWDPDHHNGSFEWLIVGGLFVIAATASAATRRDLLRRRTILAA